MSHVWAPKDPVWILTAPYGSAYKTTVHGSCGPRTGSVRCLEILTGPARTVTTDDGRFAYDCSQANKASARAPTVLTSAPYGTRRMDVQILMIPTNTDNPQNARIHVTLHIEEGCFHTDFPRVIGPYDSPSPTVRDHL